MAKLPKSVRDVSLVGDEHQQRLIAHRPSCPVVEAHRAAHLPVFTMIDIKKPLPDDVELHSCLEGR